MATKPPGWEVQDRHYKNPSQGDGAVPKHVVRPGCRISILGGFQYLKTLDKAMSNSVQC